MATTSLLNLPLPTTGTESGTWGELVDNGLTAYLDIAVAGGLSVPITTANVTLSLTTGTSSATGIISTTAQYAILNITGAKTAARSLILPSSSREYTINNAGTGGFALTVKGAATTGVTLVDGEKAIVAWSGTDYVKIASSVATALTGLVPIANGGTNNSTVATAGGVAYGTGAAYAVTAAGTAGQAIISGGAAAPTIGVLASAGGGTGTSATPAAGGITYGTGTALATTAAGTTGQVLISGVSAAPTWQQNAINRGAAVIGGGVATVIDYTAIPSGTRRITVMFNGLSTSGTSLVQVQLGTASGFIATGYLSSGATNGSSLASFTTGFPVGISAAAADARTGLMTINNTYSNFWVMGGSIGPAAYSATVSGGVSTAAVLTQLRITTVNGTDTFDAGSVNIFYE